MTNFVKFLRGTIEQYNASVKDKDTLYFIDDVDAGFGRLYLGTRLISDTAHDTSIGDLKDILIGENLSTEQILVYDPDQKKWVNKDFPSSIGAFKGATSDMVGEAGLVPAPQAGQTNLFLRSDGTWAEIKTDNPAQFFEVVPNPEETDSAALTRVVDGRANNGDIAVVKRVIFGDKAELTAYVYSVDTWKALDGNYNAENVFFDKDLVTTFAIGNIGLTNGQGTIAAEGKNLKEVFDAIFLKEEEPKVTNPSVSVKLNEAGAKEVGTVVTPTYSVTFNKGTYSYGPDTGITATYAVTDTNAGSASTATGSFTEFTVSEKTNYKVSVVASHTGGATPVTNTGNERPGAAIAEGTKSATSSAVTGYRAWFCGYKKAENAIADPKSISSSEVRNLGTSKDGSFSATMDTNAMKQMFFAAPAGKVTSVKVSNAVNGAPQTVNKATAQVEGAEGYSAVAYDVFYVDNAGAESGDSKWNIAVTKA